MRKFRCPACGDVKTEQEILEDCEAGSVGMCYCEFSAIDQVTGEVWYPRIFNEYVEIKNDE